MNKRLVSTVIAFVIAVCGANLSVLHAASQGDGDGDQTEMGEQMDTVSKSFRTLRRQARDPAKNAASAALAAKMLKAAKAAQKFEPAWTAEQPTAEQADFVAGFNKEMEVFIGLLEDLKKAFIAGDNAKAEGLIGKLRDQQKKSHKAYKKPDDD